ncbi:hypothetical protein LJR031_000087 [Caballeronia sp. LjRoot31]
MQLFQRPVGPMRREDELPFGTTVRESIRSENGDSPFANLFFLVGLLCLSLQFVSIGGAQPGQLWALAALTLFFAKNSIPVLGREILVYGLFLSTAVWLTLYSGYAHVKAPQQVMKFAVVYPAFFLVGRHLGRYYLKHKLPIGYPMIVLFFVFEIAVQKFEAPVIYKYVYFSIDAIHGSFLERNWFALFFFAVSYMVFLQSKRKPVDAVLFLAINVANALVSESKSVLIPCGIVVLLQVRGHTGIKMLLVAAGSAFYVWRFAPELSGHMLDERIKDERGLAFVISTGIAARDWLGHGFGFVEAYFSGTGIYVMGLGKGVNSIFLTPLDFFLIAGIPGILVWLIFFCGFGFGWVATASVIPIAAWSFTNPMHQSELTYLLLGYLISYSRGTGLDASAPVERMGNSTTRRQNRLLTTGISS